MTLMNDKEKFSDWDSFYKENNIKEMPWYEENLDQDLENQINAMNITKGKFLDIGTGPGTQAIQLAKLGFESTGSDISKNAIEKAQKLSKDVNFVTDDILNSSFPDNSFDFILDRGCFHVFEPSLRKDYLREIKRILKTKGTLFLKVMSIEEKDLAENEGPHKFSRQEILDTFEEEFEVQNIKPTVYYGTLDPLPKAWFVVLKQRV